MKEKSIVKQQYKSIEQFRSEFSFYLENDVNYAQLTKEFGNPIESIVTSIISCFSPNDTILLCEISFCGGGREVLNVVSSTNNIKKEHTLRYWKNKPSS